MTSESGGIKRERAVSEWEPPVARKDAPAVVNDPAVSSFSRIVRATEDRPPVRKRSAAWPVYAGPGVMPNTAPLDPPQYEVWTDAELEKDWSLNSLKNVFLKLDIKEKGQYYLGLTLMVKRRFYETGGPRESTLKITIHVTRPGRPSEIREFELNQELGRGSWVYRPLGEDLSGPAILDITVKYSTLYDSYLAIGASKRPNAP
jgi:hypothetical protein